jgi:hypothetical protein
LERDLIEHRPSRQHLRTSGIGNKNREARDLGHVAGGRCSLAILEDGPGCCDTGRGVRFERNRRGRDQEERESAKHAPDADPGARAPGAERRTASRKQRKKERFTALLHRVNVDTPWAAFYALKRKAAAGVARGGLATRSAASSNPISCVNALTTAAKTGGQTPLPSNLMRSRLDPYGRV